MSDIPCYKLGTPYWDSSGERGMHPRSVSIIDQVNHPKSKSYMPRRFFLTQAKPLHIEKYD